MSKFTDHNFAGQKVLVRVDFNVPLNDKYEITDDTRMRAAIPTIKKITGDGGIPILMSHFGRPKGGPEEKYSLKHIVAHLQKLLGSDVCVSFASDSVGQEVEEKIKGLKHGDVLLLENLRFYPEEEKGDAGFAEK